MLCSKCNTQSVHKVFQTFEYDYCEGCKEEVKADVPPPISYGNMVRLPEIYIGEVYECQASGTRWVIASVDLIKRRINMTSLDTQVPNAVWIGAIAVWLENYRKVA